MCLLESPRLGTASESRAAPRGPATNAGEIGDGSGDVDGNGNWDGEDPDLSISYADDFDDDFEDDDEESEKKKEEEEEVEYYEDDEFEDIVEDVGGVLSPQDVNVLRSSLAI